MLIVLSFLSCQCGDAIFQVVGCGNRMYVHNLSFNPNGTFCGELVAYDFPLIVLDLKSISSIHLWCMLRGSV